MSFFERFSKKATEVAQVAVTKSKELAETAKINLSISGEEDNIKKHYTEIGEAYYKARGAEVQGSLSAIVEKIDICNVKISDYKQKLVEVKNGSPVASATDAVMRTVDKAAEKTESFADKVEDKLEDVAEIAAEKVEKLTDAISDKFDNKNHLS